MPFRNKIKLHRPLGGTPKFQSLIRDMPFRNLADLPALKGIREVSIAHSRYAFSQPFYKRLIPTFYHVSIAHSRYAFSQHSTALVYGRMRCVFQSLIRDMPFRNTISRMSSSNAV